MRTEQERQSHQLEQLENRVVLAEDSARQARQALVSGAQPARPTVRIGGVEDAPTAEVHAAPPVSVSGADPSDDEPADEPAPPPNDNRPVVRLNGRDRVQPTAPNAPIVVHDGDRLPVVQVPDEPSVVPARGPHGSARPTPSERQSAVDASLRADAPGAAVSPAITGTGTTLALSTVTPGTSSVRDARALPAYQDALTLARSRRCTEALDAFSAFLVRWPDHPYAENAMYWRGECLLAAGDARRAAGEFEGQLRRFPSGSKAPDALYKLVVCYRRLGEPTRARAYGEQLVHDFGGSDAATRLRTESDR